ncbi:DNA cytosine methyltransferase [Gilvimarinus polysaccharolyticus]|uniref:DNA cytosine methyltransferase n=1 Tax=Gilvimarinus polysaccharolyticus TaxID=863921 RepID=UPI000673C63A|nr:DNA cytosine methyltransferase [Gilvimarinus polysaccharolyticus]
MKKICAIDLFCGAGGLTHGLIKSGVDVVAGFDIEASCKHAYEHNNKGAVFYNEDVQNLKGYDLGKLYPSGCIRLLAGCAPCQPFSTYSQGRDVKNDKKWPLLYAFSSLIDEMLPELVTMENVPDVTRHEVYHDFVSSLEEKGYKVWAKKIYCPDYGMPQGRSRHVLIASKIGEIKFIKPTRLPRNYKTVRDTIGRLPKLEAGQKDEKDSLHVAAGLSLLNMKRIRTSRPGGTWHDWPEDLKAECHRKSSGRGYVSVYARMSWDEPSPTITTQSYGYGNGRFGHPQQHRAISLREAAMLQTFPKSYQFVKPSEKVYFSSIGKMIGNAVPVALGKAIGKSLLKSISSS